MAKKPTAHEITTTLAELNESSKAQLVLIAGWAPSYDKGIVSYYRLDKRVTNALERRDLVTAYAMPVEGCKLTPLGAAVAAAAKKTRRKR